MVNRIGIMAAAVLAVGCFLQVGVASATGIVIVDGAMDGSDSYTDSFTAKWFNGHKTEGSIYGDGVSSFDSTTVHWAKDSSHMYLYFEVPIYAKQMVWGTGALDVTEYQDHWLTHHTGTLVMDYKTATGSEKAIYKAVFGTYEGKLQGTVKGKGVEQYATSHGWLLANSICDTTDCAASTTTMAFEWGINWHTPDVDDAAIIQGLMDDGIVFHISPERQMMPMPEPPAAMPEPSAAVLFCVGALLVGMRIRRQPRAR